MQEDETLNLVELLNMLILLDLQWDILSQLPLTWRKCWKTFHVNLGSIIYVDFIY